MPEFPISGSVPDLPMFSGVLQGTMGMFSSEDVDSYQKKEMLSKSKDISEDEKKIQVFENICDWLSELYSIQQEFTQRGIERPRTPLWIKMHSKKDLLRIRFGTNEETIKAEDLNISLIWGIRYENCWKEFMDWIIENEKVENDDEEIIESIDQSEFMINISKKYKHFKPLGKFFQLALASRIPEGYSLANSTFFITIY